MARGVARPAFRASDLPRQRVTPPVGDRELLARFCTGGSEAAQQAFDALLARHASMVWAVCRQLLRNPHDAADAFQATFLVLVRRAESVRVEASLGNWLYGVASRVALRARADQARRRQGLERLAVPVERSLFDPACTEELRALVHEELERLPAHYRAPIVLCYLQGLTHAQAAGQLGWPVGTVKGRLARARDILRGRLSRRGIALAIPLLLAVLGPARAWSKVPAAVRDQVVARAVPRLGPGPCPSRPNAPVPAASTLAGTAWSAGLKGLLTGGCKLAASLLGAALTVSAAGLFSALAAGPGAAVAAEPRAPASEPARGLPPAPARPIQPEPSRERTSAARTAPVPQQALQANDQTQQAYETERARCGRNPAAHVRLALWCEQHGLEAARWKHLAIAALADPANVTARGLMGLVLDQGRWRTPEAVAERTRCDEELARLLAEYEARRATAPRTADAQWKLALWCERQGLKAEAFAHLTAVTRLEPGREAAWRRLGYKKVTGRWLTGEQATAERAAAEALRLANRRWRPLLEKWRGWLTDKKYRPEAERKLAGVTDPLAVPAVWWLFAMGTEAQQKLAAQVFGQIEGRNSSQCLAWLAALSPSAEVRRIATETLLLRDPREFIGSLIELLRDPVKYEVRRVGGPGSPGVLLVEGQRFDVARLYAPPPLPVLPLDAPASLERDAMGWPVLWVTTYAPIAHFNALAILMMTTSNPWNGSRPFGPFELARSVGPNGGLQVAPVEQVARIAHAPMRTTPNGARQVQVPIGKMVAEIQKTAVMAQRQLESDVQQVEQFNAGLAKWNEPIVRVLAHFTDKLISGFRTDWQKWWIDAQGYSYEPPAARAKPTMVENVPLAYQPQQVGGYVFDSVAGYVPRPHSSCFAAGTLVRTRLGPKPIESIELGDQVLAQDAQSGALSFQAVVRVLHNRPAPALRIALRDETIVATGIHRFWKAGQGWVMARELKPGDAIRTCDGLARIDTIEPAPVQPVFNLEVANKPSFFVGRAGALAHDNTLVEPAARPFDALP